MSEAKHKSVKYTDQELEELRKNLASVWGGSRKLNRRRIAIHVCSKKRDARGRVIAKRVRKLHHQNYTGERTFRALWKRRAHKPKAGKDNFVVFVSHSSGITENRCLRK